jgi:hypothetical protein
MVVRHRGCLVDLFKLLAVCVGVFYVVVGVTNPWAFHIGGRPTPLLYWTGYGKLVTKGGTYPLYVMLYPSAHFSRLRVDGLRPAGGVGGTAALCTSPGTVEALKLGGTIYGRWSSTRDALMGFRLLEIRTFDIGQRQGYFDLYGRWNASDLVMDDRDRANSKFRSGVTIEHASITFHQGSYAEFKAACSNATTQSNR